MAKKKGGAPTAKETAATKRRKAMYEIISEMVSPEQTKVIEGQIGQDTFGAVFLEQSLDVAYGDIWPRKGLSRKERSLVTLGALIALKAPVELDYQFKIALKNGLTPRQLEEVILQTFPYVGVTPVSLANTIAIKILNEQGIKTQDRTDAEK